MQPGKRGVGRKPQGRGTGDDVAARCGDAVWRADCQGGKGRGVRVRLKILGGVGYEELHG